MVDSSATAMEDANIAIAKLSDLLHSPRPFTATASPLFSPAASPSPPPRPTNRCVLTPLRRPTAIEGTLTLPTHTTPSSSPCSCFRFSDTSASVCCDLLQFHPCAIGKEIRVTAWNFIPFKHHDGGLLEIIKWCFTKSSDESKGLNHVDSLPLVPNHCDDGSSRATYRVYGVVESVGPVSIVPCTMAASWSDLNSDSSVNLAGFLVQLMCCKCRLCGSKELINDMENGNGHCFTKMEIVYFCGNASSWHPAMTKLVGNRIMVSGLKKKLVYVTKEESHLMYVTVDKSVLHVCRFSKKWLPCLKDNMKVKGECGVYTGVIKGVYMKGMALELDHDVWLLLTDKLHTLIHGLRVGAIISVRNVHFVDPKFSWTKVVILGACIKTSITVESFSPLETGCNVILQSQSMLAKFIQSLPFSARLWVLLLVSSLRKMFAGILSDKEILGSKHKEGLVQMYASSLFPPSVFHTKNGAFMGLCRHDLDGCGRELHCNFLKLVIPMSIFIHHCIDTLLRMLKSNHCKLLRVGNHDRLLSREAIYNGRSVRRIISSEDVGAVLLGYIKINPSTRRLQLVDATGGTDALIPDLPFTWESDKIFEVTKYDIIVDGIGELMDHMEFFERDSLSCRMIFDCTKAARVLRTSIFIYFLFKNAKCRDFPIYPSVNRRFETEIFEPRRYHLLRVSHKFPLRDKYSYNMRLNKSTFVEAELLPCILLLAGKNGISHSCGAPSDNTKELSECCIRGNNNVQVSNKRQKLVKNSVCSMKDEFHSSICQLRACSNYFRNSKENEKCVNLSSSHDISCLVTFRSIQHENVVCPAVLCFTSSMKDTDLKSKSIARKILLEFSSDRFLTYQLLQIGGYYIIEHNREGCICTAKDAGFGSSATFRINSGKSIFSLSFISDEVLLNYKSLFTSASDSSSPSIDGILPKDQSEQLLLRSNIDSSSVCSDVCLYLPVKVAGLLGDNIIESQDSQSQEFAVSQESGNISLTTGIPVGRPILCSGSQSSNCLFPEGNLVSLMGDVVDIHDIGSSFSNSCSGGASLDALQLKGLVRTSPSLCIHVLVHHHIVKIFGSISQHAFPTGFGPGVTAIFHRILDARAQNNFLLLPVSFIVIKSIEVSDKECSESYANLRPTKDANNASPGSFSCLISQMNQCPSNKQIVIRCRVVAVLVLVLERKATAFDAETKANTKGVLLDIPLAGFVLDDGSSSCCCWANAERAATLLRLHEDLTTSYHLGRILMNYQKITVKNHGSFVELPYQDLAVSVTQSTALCSSDESLLRFIIFNACVGAMQNVVATVMDAEEVRELKKEYLAETTGNMPAMQNIWANEISRPCTLNEARNSIHELLKS